MTILRGVLESGAPMSRLHERQSYDPADFPVPTGREEETDSIVSLTSASTAAYDSSAASTSSAQQETAI
jgi:hypothetical protein